ncbi:threonine dehydratase [Streptomyces sp. CG 926]|uniref:threonine ammonia-lyase n=1 Tax=Streptomyces sp. CG 926 TaxID=1882405 RepID=UPI000D6BCDFD|nr:pyridoxal-phosphate dependent enzyme [Streptomyces sp. CG 926]PWK71292.1 threonine dehydratase [Streptomyces sp. CG 926]
MHTPTISDVLRARRSLSAHLSPTPLLSYPALDASVGAGVRVLVKHENLQPTGAFKVRGGIALLAAMDPDERARGVLSYSTGNHAQSLAHAAALFRVPCTIVMPEKPNPLKAAAVRRLGAELVEHGADFDEARRHAEQLAPRRGMRLVGAANEPGLIAGVATAYLEVLEQEPDLDAIVVPVGGGSGAAAACLVAAAISPRCRVIAVQSRHSPAAHDSWRSGRCVERTNTTTAEGLATGAGFELTQRLLRAHLADFLLVDDDEIRRAQWLLMRDARTVAEGAAAAPLAGLLSARDGLAGQRVAIMCTGGNAGESDLRACLSAATSG